MKFPVDLHTHTIASDHAYSTIHDYIRQAASMGIEMFACTDHGPELSDGPHLSHFHNLRVVPRIVDNVAILRGIEANITANGFIDINKESVNKLDIVLAGFHPNIEPTDKDNHTALMVSVIKSGLVDVISHPGNPKYPIDYEEVLVCAKENNVAIEINSSSDINTRKGSHKNCVAVASLARKIGNIVSLGTDAHISFFLGNFDESCRIIKESGLSEDQIINTSALKVMDFLESRGHAPIKEIRNHFAGK